MRWLPTLLAVYLVVLLQATVGKAVTFSAESIGHIGPDLVAVLAVFVALHVADGSEVMIACWLLGFGVDLTTAGGPAGETVVGPMSAAYALAGGCVHRIRDAFFSERPVTQAIFTMLFCAIAHGLWITAQSLRAGSAEPLVRMLPQAGALVIYTGLLMPLAHPPLLRIRRLFMHGPAGELAGMSRR